MESPHTLTILEASASIRLGKLSPVDLVESCLSRIRDLDHRINAFVAVLEASARERAMQAENEIARGDYRGPLHGIPVAVKDVFALTGVPTCAGSKVLERIAATEDSTMVSRLRAAGAVIVGKTNMSELALGFGNENLWFGDTHNPWNLDRIPGGSSGGSAAAVAAGMCLAALGSDTGGSARVPAACCGVVGLKPSYDACSRVGMVPLARSLDTVGILARSVEDAAAILDILADPVQSRHERAAVRGMSAGVPADFFFRDIDPQVRSAVDRAVDVLKSLGMTIREIGLPGLEHAEGVKFAILLAEAASTHERSLLEKPQDLSPQVRALLGTGCLISAVDYLHAQHLRSRITECFDRALSAVDILITPTMPLTASRIGQQMLSVAGKPEMAARALGRLTYPISLSGHPALSVPCGFDADGLPVGMQLIGARHGEGTVLRVGRAYQEATTWRERRPTFV